MPIQVSDHFDWIHLSLDLNLIGLHCLLDPASDFSEPRIDSCLSDARVCGVLDCLQESVVDGIECDGEGAVDDPALDVRSEVYLADIVVAEHCVVPDVWRVVSSNVVQRAASRESNAGLEALFGCQLPIVVFEFFAYVDQPSSRLDDPLSKSSHLPLNLSSLSQILQMLFTKQFFGFQLFSLDPRNLVLTNFIRTIALKLIVRKLMFDRYLPTSKAPKDFIRLSGRKLFFQFSLHFWHLLTCGSCFSGFHSFLLLFVFLLLFLLLLSFRFSLFLLFFVLFRLRFLFLLLLHIPKHLKHALFLSKLHS